MTPNQGIPPEPVVPFACLVNSFSCAEPSSFLIALEVLADLSSSSGVNFDGPLLVVLPVPFEVCP